MTRNAIAKIRTKTNCDTDRIVTELLRDNPLISAKVAKYNPNDDDTFVFAAVKEVIRFLNLCSQADQAITPSVRVDEIWHELILFTRSYARLCEERFNNFIHHQPSSHKTQERIQYEATLALYRKNYGLPDPFFWPQVDTQECGSCARAE